MARTGLIVVPDFLSPDMLAAVDSETREFLAASTPTWLHEHGTTQVRHYLLNTAEAQQFTHLSQWRHDDKVQSVASAAERRNLRRVDGGSLVEHLTLGDYSVPDTQSDLHVDTFFNTHKLWLYLDDVNEENAPFVYVPGSHRLDRVRLRQEYRASMSADEDKSRRVTDDEVHSRGLEKRIVTCPRNTLMVANTCGYHARSIGQPGATRLALHKAFRFNPFNPFTPVPGQPSRLKTGMHRPQRGASHPAR